MLGFVTREGLLIAYAAIVTGWLIWVDVRPLLRAWKPGWGLWGKYDAWAKVVTQRHLGVVLRNRLANPKYGRMSGGEALDENEEWIKFRAWEKETLNSLANAGASLSKRSTFEILDKVPVTHTNNRKGPSLNKLEDIFNEKIIRLTKILEDSGM